MTGNRPIIYADTCVFIAWLADEQRKLGEMEGVAGLVSAVDRNEIVLVTSSILKTELIKLDRAQSELLARFLNRRNVEMKDATLRINEIASEIRTFYQNLRDTNKTNLPTVTTPDAIHLATAIYWDCEKFFTFDENDEEGGTRPKRALIPLSGVVAGRYPLEICKPLVREPSFAF